MPKKRSTHIQFRASEIEDAILSRERSMDTSPNAVAKRDLGRYYDLLSASMPGLSRREALLLCDICNGTLFDSVDSMRFLWAEAADAEDAYFEKHNVDRDELVQTLRALSPAEALAVADAIERFWAAPNAPDALENAFGLPKPSENGQAGS